MSTGRISVLSQQPTCLTTSSVPTGLIQSQNSGNSIGLTNLLYISNIVTIYVSPSIISNTLIYMLFLYSI